MTEAADGGISQALQIRTKWRWAITAPPLPPTESSVFNLINATWGFLPQTCLPSPAWDTLKEHFTIHEPYATAILDLPGTWPIPGNFSLFLKAERSGPSASLPPRQPICHTGSTESSLSFAFPIYHQGSWAESRTPQDAKPTVTTQNSTQQHLTANSN